MTEATVLTGNQIPAFRIMTLRRGLKLEVETSMRLTRGRSCYAIIKDEFGFKGNKKKVLAQLEAWIAENILPAQ